MERLSKATISRVHSLDDRRGRKREAAWKAEGTKCVLDTLGHFSLDALYATPAWISEHPEVAVEATPCTSADLERMSSLVTPPPVIAVYKMPDYAMRPGCAREGLVLALDTIQDPGNLGTIIRVADWFGITDLLCSDHTADCFAPKVIQASMGSISRVRVVYGDLPALIAESGAKNVYGTFLDGASITGAHLSREGVIVIGNEGRGISAEVEAVVTERLLIPSYPPGRPTGESLNAAVATAITLAKFRGI